MFSARNKLRYLNDGCDVCIVKERSVPARVGEHFPSLTGYVGEKLYIDLVSMSDTVRGNRYLPKTVLFNIVTHIQFLIKKQEQ